jgi:hypothetical protein
MAIILSTQAEAQDPKKMLENRLVNESMPNYDTVTYSLNNGISYEEGSRRFALRNKIDNLEERLIHDNPNTFAGLWLEHTPEFKLVVQFVGEPQKDISTYLSKELTAITEVRHAEFSLVDLERVRTEALESIISEGEIPIESDIDVKKNRVELYVTDENYIKSRNAVQNIGLGFSSNTKVINVPSLSNKEANIYGGLTTYTTALGLTPQCTIGFSVKNTLAITGVPVGTRGVTTAGHCLNNTQYYGGILLKYVKGLDSGPYDVEWHTTSSYIPTNKIQVSTTGLTRNITGARLAASQIIGEYVCKYGRTTKYTCGYIASKTYKPANHDGKDIPGSSVNAVTHTATFIRVTNAFGGVRAINGKCPDGSIATNGDICASGGIIGGLGIIGVGTNFLLSDSGDSGGPWFVEGIAYGTHSGRGSFAQSSHGVYMPINYMSGINAAVLTTP